MPGSDIRATHFVTARRQASAVQSYPGPLPTSLEEAYTIQDVAIDAWQDTLVGWKVGGIAGDWAAKLNADRLVGPVFSRQVHIYNGEQIDMPVFADGFAAVEGEVTAILGEDAPSGKTDFTHDEALALIASLHVGVEIASSPFEQINDHGPLVTITDFGNNYGLILGPEINDWQNLEFPNWQFETFLNGASVGADAPSLANGGPVESVRVLLENAASRGRPVTAGTAILTGAVTGVHRAYAGDEAHVEFPGADPIKCRLVPARAVASA